jgi:hypothetical protein
VGSRSAEPEDALRRRYIDVAPVGSHRQPGGIGQSSEQSTALAGVATKAAAPAGELVNAAGAAVAGEDGKTARLPGEVEIAAVRADGDADQRGGAAQARAGRADAAAGPGQA